MSPVPDDIETSGSDSERLPSRAGPGPGTAGVSRASERRAGLLLVLLLAIAGALDIAGCRGLGREPAPAPPVPRAASDAFRRARTLRAEAAPTEQVLAELDGARAGAPDWAAPGRLADDLERERLLGAEALAAHLAALTDAPEDPTRLYLLGRLEGRAGAPRFRKALALDPSHAWAWHGQGWMLHLAGDTEEAWESGRRAVALARDAWERGQFLTAMARYALALEEPARALALFDEHGLGPEVSERDPAVSEGERLELLGWRAQLELARASEEDEDDTERRTAYGRARALSLLGSPELSEARTRALLQALRMHTLLEDRATVRVELRARLAERGDALGRALLFEDELGGVRGPAGLAAQRSARAALGLDPLAPRPRGQVERDLAEGLFGQAAEDWLAAQPRLVLAADGAPRHGPLRLVLEALQRAEAAPVEDGPPVWRQLGEALARAGWFRELQAFAVWLRPHERELALELAALGLRGQAAVDALGDLIVDLDDGRARARSPEPAGAPGDLAAPESNEVAVPESVDALLAALEPRVQRALGPVASRFGLEAGALALGASPRLRFGPFADLVHPGPTFSPADAAAGRGEVDAPVPGLASLGAALGRFVLLGAVRGSAPDGSVLRLVALDQAEGSLLGVPFQGTVAWCEGQDLESRPGRSGARITGAALHEGYWIDIEAVRRDHARWRQLQARWIDAEPPVAIDRVLSQRGPLAEQAGEDTAASYGAADVGDRIRLAVLEDRAEQLRSNGLAVGERELISLDDLLRVVERHEQGHLCDRTRFLPLARHWARAVGFAIQNGLSPARIARAVEYRAQLTALCAVEDPRLALAEVVDSVGGGSDVTPHAAAYEELLGDLLAELKGGLDAFPALDPEHLLIHQLPRLEPEQVRRVARDLARRKGMLEDED